VLVEMEMSPVDAIAGVVWVAGMLSSGIVSWRFAGMPELKEMPWRAERLTSTEAPPEEVLAVTTPIRTAGEDAPASATSGIVFRFVPFGTFTTEVAL